MTKPYFTVAVIAHQPEPSLQKTLNSISGQTFPDFECLMIVEDSSGRSFEICKKMEYRDPRFRTVQLPESGSASASRNYAMAHAEGEYIAFLDGGDRFMPEMLERVYTANEKFRNLDIIQFTFQKVFQQPDGAFSAPQILSELPPEAMNRLLTGPEMTLLTVAPEPSPARRRSTSAARISSAKTNFIRTEAWISKISSGPSAAGISQNASSAFPIRSTFTAAGTTPAPAKTLRASSSTWSASLPVFLRSSANTASRSPFRESGQTNGLSGFWRPSFTRATMKN